MISGSGNSLGARRDRRCFHRSSKTSNKVAFVGRFADYVAVRELSKK